MDTTLNTGDQANHALWGGRFEASPEKSTQAFGASLPVDKNMWEADIEGSKAHAKMLARQKVISDDDASSIVSGLDRIAESIRDGSFVFDIDDEDIHMSIEKQLTKLIGQAGGRLHTGRSRNDQVATDARLHAKKLAMGLCRSLIQVRRTLIDLARSNFGVVMPGYTHMQKGQPVLFSHHVLAYYWMFTRDFDRMVSAYDAADVSVLGSAALAGTTYPLDRHYVAEELGFSSVSENSMDSVSDRDFLLDLSYACAVCMMHLSRLCEEIIYWSSNEFSFIGLSDSYSTGSSIMPQKKNPDFAELIRGKTGRVYGDLMALLTTMKGLPLSYNKDMQEDKEGVFDAVATLSDSLAVMDGMLSTMRVNEEAMREGAHGGFMAATDLADHLVGKGVPFREAHAIIGALVLDCEKQGKTLQDLTVEELKAVDDRFDEDALDAVDIDKVVSRRCTYGATGHDAVEVQIEHAASRLDEDSSSIGEWA